MVSDYLTSTSIPRVDGLSTDPPVLGRHSFGVVLRGFHGGFLIWDELEEVYGRKMSENGENFHFRGRTRGWYRYPLCRRQVVPVPLKVVLVPIGSRVLVLVPVPVHVVPVPMFPATLFLHVMQF